MVRLLSSLPMAFLSRRSPYTFFTMSNLTNKGIVIVIRLLTPSASFTMLNVYYAQSRDTISSSSFPLFSHRSSSSLLRAKSAMTDDPNIFGIQIHIVYPQAFSCWSLLATHFPLLYAGTLSVLIGWQIFLWLCSINYVYSSSLSFSITTHCHPRLSYVRSLHLHLRKRLFQICLFHLDPVGLVCVLKLLHLPSQMVQGGILGVYVQCSVVTFLCSGSMFDACCWFVDVFCVGGSVDYSVLTFTWCLV